MEKRSIAIATIAVIVAIVAVAAVMVVNDDSSDDGSRISQSYNLGTNEFVEDRIACEQTSLAFGDAGSITYSVSSEDSGWAYNGVTMYDVHITVQVATHCSTRDFSIRGTFSGSATLVDDPTTNYSDLIYEQSKGTASGMQWFGYSYHIDSAYTYVFSIDAHVLLDAGEAGLDLQFDATFIDNGDTYHGYAEADIAIKQSTEA